MAKKIKDPGFGNTSSPFAKQVITKRGNYCVNHLNKKQKFSESYDFLVRISWSYFFILSLATYLLANLFFAGIYTLIGVDQISVLDNQVSFTGFLNAFFFSCQTFTSLGYGSMSPNGISSGIVSSLESFVGLLYFAFVTSLLYGRFSKPRPSLRFSKHIVLREFKGKNAIMFRVVNNRVNAMINPKIKVNLNLATENSSGEFVNNYYDLILENDRITYLPTTWTIVHEIDVNSPLFDFNPEEITKLHGEFLILMSYYDEAFNQDVYQMYSYSIKEIILNYKFVKAYYYDSNGRMTMNHNLFDIIEPHES